MNAVAPAVVGTAAVRDALTDDGVRRIVERTPMGRLADPADVASTVVFLASPASKYVTGEVIEVDGGAEGPTFPLDIADLQKFE